MTGSHRSSRPGVALDTHLRRAIAAMQPTPRADGELGRAELELIFDAQAGSRQLDLEARALQSRGDGYYTIGSAGHESNAVIARATRPTDPALLHYRSGAFYLARAAQHPDSTPIRDVLQGLMGLAEEPIAGGRHKVFGRRELNIIPQTSTIASHLPRAVGLAMALSRARRIAARVTNDDLPRPEPEWPADAIVLCSFGDASANHSTATGAINTALNTSYRGLPVPILFICEDNGYGISVPTPNGWIAEAYGSRPGLDYLHCDGRDVEQVHQVATEAARRVREQRRPVFLHLSCVRFLAHAGSDAEISYRNPRAVEADYAADPLLGTAQRMVDLGVPPDAVLTRYDAARERVDIQVTALGGRPRLATAEEVMAPIAPRRPERVAVAADALTGPAAEPRTLAESINATLETIMERDPRVLVFGEDVGVKGGVYGLTRGLARTFGAARVFDTLLDEQSILGLALGSGLAGMLPVPEIQYLAYLHNAIDQLRGEAATQQFFSTGQYRNPMVLRLPGLSYQKGFGGHFHNDNAVASLRDIPGLVVGCPSRGDDAAAMLRELVAAGLTDGTVSVFLEPIALYHRRDLHQADDNGWLTIDRGSQAPIGVGRQHGEGTDLTLISYGNGVPMCLQAARRLEQRKMRTRVLDLRWLAPLPVEDIVQAAAASGRVLVVDETRHSGGVGEGVITALVEAGYSGQLARVASRDSFIPLGQAADHVLLGTDEIEAEALKLNARGRIFGRRVRI